MLVEEKPIIYLQVLSVSRHNSSQYRTAVIRWEGEKSDKETKQGAEWEEIELRILQEEKPTIEVANIIGNAFIAGSTMKLIINNPALFGTLKVNDIVPLVSIPLVSVPLVSEKKTAN
jgi:hypothetical protein